MESARLYCAAEVRTPQVFARNSREVCDLRQPAQENSAYRSGCHKFLFLITRKSTPSIVTPV